MRILNTASLLQWHRTGPSADGMARRHSIASLALSASSWCQRGSGSVKDVGGRRVEIGGISPGHGAPKAYTESQVRTRDDEAIWQLPWSSGERDKFRGSCVTGVEKAAANLGSTRLVPLHLFGADHHLAWDFHRSPTDYVLGAEQSRKIYGSTFD